MKVHPVVAMAQVDLPVPFFQFGTRAFTPSAFGSSAHDLPCSYAQYLCYKTIQNTPSELQGRSQLFGRSLED